MGIKAVRTILGHDVGVVHLYVQYFDVISLFSRGSNDLVFSNGIFKGVVFGRTYIMANCF